MKTILKDRTLWFDGTCEMEPEQVPSLFLAGVKPEQVVVTSMNEDIELFNQLSEEMIKVGKTENAPFDFEWNIPPEYLNINLDEYILSTANTLGVQYVERAKAELKEINDRELVNVFKTLIYILDVLRMNKQVWGVGRGSSCASLVLFIIGVHEVDPVKYSIPLTEFFHD